MKKIIALVLLLACVFALSSCNLAIDLVVGTIVEAYPDYKYPETKFSHGALEITLTEAFLGDDGVGYNGLWLDTANGTTAVVTRADFLNLDYEPGLSVAEYAEQHKLGMPDNYVEEAEIGVSIGDFSDVVTRGEYAYYTADVSFVFETRYLFAIFSTASEIYCVEFSGPVYNYEEYEPYYLKWADSVVIDNSNSEI